MKKLSTILILLIIFLVGTFVIVKQKNIPNITLLSPNGGEILEAGSIHTIAWETKNIPKENKISVSLRRVLTPNETIEGQEFDPLIFIDLENTGSIDWKVSDLYPEGNYVLEVTSYDSLPITNPISAESDASFEISKAVITDESWLIYQNEAFSYQVNYPNTLALREFSEIGTGADFVLESEEDFGCITISARQAVDTKASLSFADYVKESAIQEIQGVNELVSIEAITTNNNALVYKTTWRYNSLSEESPEYLSIAYLEGPGKVGAENYKTIQLSLNNSRCETVYNQMLLTLGK